MSKQKEPDNRPLDVILEEKFRDWLIHGMPYDSLEEMRYSKQTRPDGTVKTKVYQRRRPLNMEETKMIVAFLNRKIRRFPVVDEMPAVEKTVAERLREGYAERFRLKAK